MGRYNLCLVFKVIIVVISLSGCSRLGYSTRGDAAPSSKSTDTSQEATVPQRSYYHNYPHAVPPDYAFRTERVFPSPEKKYLGFIPKKFVKKFFTSPQEKNTSAEQAEELATRVRELTSQILDNSQEDFVDEYAVSVSTFVNLNNLYKTSAFGRLLGEQMISELQRVGIDVIDVRKSPGIMIKEEYGEYGLSRDMNELSFVHPVQALIVGTYNQADGQVFVNARLLRNSDSKVLASGSMIIERNSVVERLLADEEMPAADTGSTVQVKAY